MQSLHSSLENSRYRAQKKGDVGGIYEPQAKYVSLEEVFNLEKESPLKLLSEYWREQADHCRDQEKAWHDVASFCRQVKVEMAKKRKELRKAIEGYGG